MNGLQLVLLAAGGVTAAFLLAHAAYTLIISVYDALTGKKGE